MGEIKTERIDDKKIYQKTHKHFSYGADANPR